MLVQILRWFRGYLKMKLKGKTPERFVNLCKFKQIKIWDLHSEECQYEMKVSVSDFYKLKSIIRKTKVRPDIMEKKGFPFLAYKFRKRKCFLAGMLGTILFLLYMSTFLWEIDITGNTNVTDDLIFDYLESESIYHGMKKNRIQCEDIVNKIRQRFPEIIWASASLNGTCLSIELKENGDSYQVIQEEKEASDLIASHNGKVVKIVTRKGIPQVSVGDDVLVGDVLVSGTIPVLNDSGEVTSCHYVQADGDIWIETTELYSDSIRSAYLVKKYDGNEYMESALFIGKKYFKITLFQNENEYLKESVTDQMELTVTNHFVLPIRMTVEKIKLYKHDTAFYSEEEREEMLTKRFERYCAMLEKQDCIILEHKLNIIHQSDKSNATSTIKLQIPVGDSRKTIDLSSDTMIQ